MSTPIDPELEDAVGPARSNRGSRLLLLVAAVFTAALIAGAGLVASRMSHSGDASGAARVGESPATSTPTTADDPQSIVVAGERTVHLRNRPRPVGSAIGTGVTASFDGRWVAYEYDTPMGHGIATIDTNTCDARACIETVVAIGHSPVFSAEGALAYVALDDGTPRLNEAMWKRVGSVTVRAPDGTTRVWARAGGFQTVGWAGTTLLVEHDRPDADTEGYEELMLYRGPGDRAVLTQQPVAISPDGTRLLFSGTGTGTDRMLELYDVATERVVSSISIADYQRALVPPSDLAGVDLSRWPVNWDVQPWPLSCCVMFSPQARWQDDLVLIPGIYIGRPTDGEPEIGELRPAVIRIIGDRIVPLEALATGVTEYYDAHWLPGSTAEFVLKKSAPLPSPGVFLRCRIDGMRSRCDADSSLAWVFRLPTVSAAAPTGTRQAGAAKRPPDVVGVRQLGCTDPQPVRVRVDLPNLPPGDLEIEVLNRASGAGATIMWERSAIESPDREGRHENFDVPGRDCPGNTQMMTIWVDTPDGTDLHAAIPLVFPPPGADGVSTLVVTPVLT